MLKQGQDSRKNSTSHANATHKALLVSENNEIWIIDTGATNHMVSKIGMLTKESVIKTTGLKPVYLPNGEVGNVTHIGS